MSGPASTSILRAPLTINLVDQVQRIVVADVLAVARDAQQRLVRKPGFEPVDQALDRLWLLARRLISGF